MTSPSVTESDPESIATPKLRFRIVACLIFLVVFQAWTISASLPLALAGAADFRMLYSAGSMIRTGSGRGVKIGGFIPSINGGREREYKSGAITSPATTAALAAAVNIIQRDA